MIINTGRLMSSKRSLILAYDQGLEHGPTDFNVQNVDPEYILDIAVNGKFNGMILQPGIAAKYFENYRKRVPLIIKINGKTSLQPGEPVSRQDCSVAKAVKLGADAVGYTLFIGSEHEHIMINEFSKIIEEAHNFSIPVIGWMYPRGRAVANPTSTEMIAYAARAGLELGADFVKIHYNNDLEGFKWAVKAAGKTHVLVAGGQMLPDREMLQRAWDVMHAGATGIAVGRGVWQHPRPYLIAQALKEIVFWDRTVEDAMKILE